MTVRKFHPPSSSVETHDLRSYGSHYFHEGLLVALVRNAWERNVHELMFLHDDGEVPSIFGSRTGIVGSKVRGWLRKSPALGSYVYVCSINHYDPWATAVRLRPHRDYIAIKKTLAKPFTTRLDPRC